MGLKPSDYAMLGGMVGGPLLGAAFSRDPAELQSFEGTQSDPEAMMHGNKALLDSIMPLIMGRANAGVSLPSAVVQQPGAYCLRQNERILTSSLEWVPCGDIQVGTPILAFDEQTKVGGRSWAPAIVTMSKPTKARCVKVVLENGESVVTTEDHPWLVECVGRHGVSPVHRKWIRSSQLMKQDWRRDHYRVLRVATPWKAESSFDAGWLSGIWDGEGSINHGRQTWKAQVAQLPGAVSDAIYERMRALGFSFAVRINNSGRSGRPINNICLTGDFHNLLDMIGRLRPVRLIEKVISGIHQRRLIASHKLRVVAVERFGYKDIQNITTSAGTYIGEGFLMHNTGGGLPMPIGLVASDPALKNPGLLKIPGLSSMGGLPEGTQVKLGPDGNAIGPRSPNPDESDWGADGEWREPGESGPFSSRAGDVMTAGPRRRSAATPELFEEGALINPGDDLQQALGSVELLLEAYGSR